MSPSREIRVRAWSLAFSLNFLVFSSLLGPGDEFLIEQPGYQPLWLTPEMLGARRINLPREYHKKFRIDVELVQELFTQNAKLVVLTNLHNPSGVLTERTSLEQIAASKCLGFFQAPLAAEWSLF